MAASTPRVPVGIRLVAFDLDGTLIDSIGDIATSVNEALAERYGQGATLPEELVRGHVGGGARQLIERCLLAGARPESDLDAVFEMFLPIYRSRLVETTRPYPGMTDALDALARRAALAVLTNKPGDMSRTIVRELGLDHRFVAVIGGDDLKSRKPEPEGLLSLGRHAGLPGIRPDQIALVGDSAVDVATARNAGALSVGVGWGYDRAGLERMPPDFMVETPQDLARLFTAR